MPVLQPHCTATGLAPSECDCSIADSGALSNHGLAAAGPPQPECQCAAAVRRSRPKSKSAHLHFPPHPIMQEHSKIAPNGMGGPVCPVEYAGGSVKVPQLSMMYSAGSGKH